MRRGFTLIELMIAVGIVGILASVVVISAVSARTKARDFRRVQDVKELAKAFDLQSMATPSAFLQDCAQGVRTDHPNLCTLPADFPMQKFKDVHDPSGKEIACGRGVSSLCQYSIGSQNSTFNEYEICFKLERSNPSLPPSQGSLYRITFGGQILAGCDYQAQAQ